MYPVIFSFGKINIYSFGLMMGISFIVGNWLMTKEFKRRKLNPEFASNITLIALVAGVSGSKILYLLENWSEFIQDPIGMAFSPGGLTFYGGFLLAMASIYYYTKKIKIPFLRIADATVPALMLAYGIARIGCHLAGDGDYGFPTTLPWGTDYSKGTYPPMYAFKDFPEIVEKYGVNGVVPNNIPCHPTPVYEFLICSAFFVVLWKKREQFQKQDGKLFALYLVLAGIERFSIEFLRLNPRLLFGLSEAQIIAAILIIVGAISLQSYHRAEKHL